VDTLLLKAAFSGEQRRSRVRFMVGRALNVSRLELGKIHLATVVAETLLATLAETLTEVAKNTLILPDVSR